MPEVHWMRAAVHKKGANLELIVLPAILGLTGSIEDFPYESDKFDVVFAYCYLDFLEAEERKIAL